VCARSRWRFTCEKANVSSAPGLVRGSIHGNVRTQYQKITFRVRFNALQGVSRGRMTDSTFAPTRRSRSAIILFPLRPGIQSSRVVISEMPSHVRIHVKFSTTVGIWAPKRSGTSMSVHMDAQAAWAIKLFMASGAYVLLVIAIIGQLF